MPDKDNAEESASRSAGREKPVDRCGRICAGRNRTYPRGKHGARSPEQAIAIGLSKARRAGVPLKPPKKGQTKKSTRRSAERDYAVGQGKRKPSRPSRKRSKAMTQRLKREPKSAVSHSALSRHAKRVAHKRKS